MRVRLDEAKLWINEGFSILRTVTALGVSRSLIYEDMKQANPEKPKRGRPIPGFSKTNSGKVISDEQIEEFLMEAIEGEEGVYGYKKLTKYLRNEHDLCINKKKVRRLCGKLGILLPARHAPSLYPRRLARQHLIKGPNQLWQLDIKYGSIEESGRFFFLASAIDVYDRKIVGYYRGPHCKATDITGMLREALKGRNISLPEGEEEFSLIIRTDNGPQFLSKEFGSFCQDHRIYHERIPPKSPNLNAFIESFHSIIERECYRRHDFECFEEAYYWIDSFMDFYNNRRYHGSLNYLSPSAFHQRYLKEGFEEAMAISL